MLPAFVIVFGTLFLVIRWWRQADPLRSSAIEHFVALGDAGHRVRRFRDAGISRSRG